MNLALTVACYTMLAGREWQLMDASGEDRAPGGLVYQFEYRVRVSCISNKRFLSSSKIVRVEEQIVPGLQ